MPLILNGATSGSTTIQATDAVTQTITLPNATGTVITTGNIPTGSVLQVVQSSYSTFTSSSSSTYADTGLSASITPSSSSNKILVFATMLGVGKNTGNCRVGLKLVRNSTSLDEFSTETAQSAWNTTTQVDVGTTSSITLDSPATTSSTTYKVQLAATGNTAQVFINNLNGSAKIGCTLTLMEIKG